jgi:hypothetical protein
MNAPRRDLSEIGGTRGARPGVDSEIDDRLFRRPLCYDRLRQLDAEALGHTPS